MKILLLLLLLVSVSALAQKKSTPPNSAGAKQMQEQMEKELRELEKDAPEVAKQVREIMKGKQTDKQPQKLSPGSAKFVSPIKHITLKSPVTPPTAQQATDKLLWFKGKKIDASTLVTIDGTLIRYNHASNEVIIQSSTKKDPFNDIVKELSKSEQRKNEFITEVSNKKNSFFFYPAIMNTLKEYDNITQRYKALVKNTINLPPSVLNTTSFVKRVHSGLASYFNYRVNDEISEETRKLYNEVLQELKNAPPLDVPIPPSRDFDLCFDCDSNVQKKYNQAVDNWMENFWKYEKGLMQKAISVEKEVADIRNNSEADKMWQDMNQVHEFVFSRADKKVEMLLEQNGKDFSRVPALLQISIAVERQKQLLGVHASDNSMQKISSMLDGFDEYMQHQMDLKNYNTVLNIAFVLGMERQKQLLGAGEDEGKPYLDRLFAFNRFKLTMDMDFDLLFKNSEEEPTLKANGTTGTAQNVYVSLGFVDCKYQLYLTNTDYKNAEESAYRIPLTAKRGTKSVKDDEHKWVTYSYSGPKEMLVVFPELKISFCDNSQPDSMYVETIRYKADDLSEYASSVQKGYTIDFMGYANNLFMNISQLEASIDETKNIGLEMLKTLTTPQIKQSTGNATLDQLQNDYNMVVKQQQLQTQLSATAMMPKTLILFDAKNNDNVVIDAETNTAHKNGQMELVKGLIKVKVVHDPLPYDKAPVRKPLKKN